ncbi:MAG TPA: hypothetical protein VEP49_18315 [Acidimicrobiia bacterium]|nr:hypothetical protein [Acidimicrobiia bacterium]
MSQLTEAFGGGDHGRQLVPGSLRGYRTWRRVGWRGKVPDGTLPLTAVTRRSVVWGPTIYAQCTEPDVAIPITVTSRFRLPGYHRSPEARCECGIYAWYSPDDTAVLDAGLFGVFGVIQASGLILMGDRGFRAERAQIVAVVTRNKRVAEACTNVGVAVYRRRRDLLRDYPPEDLSALLGDDKPDGTDTDKDPDTKSDAEPRPTPKSSSPWQRTPRGFSLAICVAVWARALLVAVIAILLPLAVAVFTAVAAEIALLFMIGMRLRR